MTKIITTISIFSCKFLHDAANVSDVAYSKYHSLFFIRLLNLCGFRSRSKWNFTQMAASCYSTNDAKMDTCSVSWNMKIWFKNSESEMKKKHPSECCVGRRGIALACAIFVRQHYAMGTCNEQTNMKSIVQRWVSLRRWRGASVSYTRTRSDHRQ